MGKRKSGQPWTNADINQLKKLAKHNVDTDDIARKLERSKYAIYTKASEEKISLKPKDK